MAKMLTLQHPESRQMRLQGVLRSTNDVLHGWLKKELADIVDALPPQASQEGQAQEGQAPVVAAVVWGGRRLDRRERARQRRHTLGGSCSRTLGPLMRVRHKAYVHAN